VDVTVTFWSIFDPVSWLNLGRPKFAVQVVATYVPGVALGYPACHVEVTVRVAALAGIEVRIRPASRHLADLPKLNRVVRVVFMSTGVEG
jgi:hypothetical protein